MTVVIQLDAPALAALFPEGSEARLHLTKAVVANFVSRNLSPTIIGKEVASMLVRARAEAVTAVLAESTKLQWGSGPVVADHLKAMFAKEARDRVQDELAPLMREAVAAHAKSLGGMLKHDVEAAVNRHMAATILQTVRDKVKEAMESALRNASGL